LKLAQNRFAEMGWCPMIEGAGPDQRNDPLGSFELFRTAWAFVQMLAKSLALLRAQAIVDEIFESFARFVTRHD
jgi:hypothetical protein